MEIKETGILFTEMPAVQLPRVGVLMCYNHFLLSITFPSTTNE
jgi:hypothetical protein